MISTVSLTSASKLWILPPKTRVTHLAAYCVEPFCKIYNFKHKSVSFCIPELKIDSIQDFQWQYTSAALNIWHDSVSFVVQPALTEVLLRVLLHCNAFSQCVLSKCWHQHISHIWKKKALQRPAGRLCINLWLLAGMHFRHGIYLEPRPNRIASHLFLNHHFNHRASTRKLCKQFYYFKPGLASNSWIRTKSQYQSTRRNTNMDFDQSFQQVSGFCHTLLSSHSIVQQGHGNYHACIHVDIQAWDHLLIFVFRFLSWFWAEVG